MSSRRSMACDLGVENFGQHTNCDAQMFLQPTFTNPDALGGIISSLRGNGASVHTKQTLILVLVDLNVDLLRRSVTAPP